MAGGCEPSRLILGGHHNYIKAMRRLLRPLWLVLALLFLVEAWVWDHVKPLVSAVFGLVAWDKLKQTLRDATSPLRPYPALIVFAVPLLLILLPLKFLEIYVIATGHWLLAGFVLVAAKFVGLGVTAFMFDTLQDKLLRIGWFRTLFDWFVWARDWAHRQVEPLKDLLRRYARWLKAQGRGKFLRQLTRLRRRMQGV